MSTVDLSEESTRALATEICKRFFECCEQLLQEGEEGGLLAFLLKSYLLEELEKRERKKQEREIIKRINKMSVRPVEGFAIQKIDDAIQKIDDAKKLQGRK